MAIKQFVVNGKMYFGYANKVLKKLMMHQYREMNDVKTKQK